jgi:hypothetical protein
MARAHDRPTLATKGDPMLKTAIHGCVIALSVGFISGAILWTTDPLPVLAMAAGAAMLYLPVADNAKARFERRADERAQGSAVASERFFVRSLREFTHEHEQRVIGYAERTGRAEALLGEREAKLSRMIGHKDSRGRFSKAPAPTIEGEAIEEG